MLLNAAVFLIVGVFVLPFGTKFDVPIGSLFVLWLILWCFVCNILKYFEPDSREVAMVGTGSKKYQYNYQRHPFDYAQKFYINAPSQKEADLLARDEFARLVEGQQTVMRNFYSVITKRK